MFSKHIDTIILIQSMSRLGGTEIAALHLKDALNERGISVAILSIEQYLGDNVNIISLNHLDGQKNRIRKYNLFKRFTSYNWRNCKTRQSISYFCVSCSVKTIINFSYENISVLPYNQNIKTIGVYHWSLKGYEQSLFAIAEKKKLPFRILSKYVLTYRYDRLHKLLSEADFAVALTESGADELKSINEKCNVTVIPNFLTYGIKKISISNRVHRHAVYVGRLSREKGVYHLLEIWAKIANRLSDVTLSIYGDGYERSQMEYLIRQRNIPSIKIMGFETNPSVIYKNSDILLCTSETEGFGMVLIEAMSHGVVPIAFDCPVSPKELIGTAGIIVDCFDCEKYATKVVELLQDKILLDYLRQQGYKRAQDFLKENVIDKWLQILN